MEGTKCSECGGETSIRDGTCIICGFALFKPLTLVRPEGGDIKAGRLVLRIGQRHVRSLFGDEARYWDRTVQFTIEPREAHWILLPNVSATNETLVDGVAATGEVRLRDGNVLSIGRMATGVQKTHLVVRIG